MAQQNYRVASFAVTGMTTFNATAAGVFVVDGSAITQRALIRMEDLPYGGVHDIDGALDAPLVPGNLWNTFKFQAANPAAHPQYSNLVPLQSKHGILTLRIPSSSSQSLFTCPARLADLSGDWRPPYAQGTGNSLIIRALWRLKDFPAPA